MARLPRTGANSLAAKQGSHIVSFTADYLNLAAPSAPHQAITTGIPRHCLLGSNLKVGALRVTKNRPLTEVPRSPYTAAYQRAGESTPIPRFSLRWPWAEVTLFFGPPSSFSPDGSRPLEAGDPDAAPTAGNTQPHFYFLLQGSCKKPYHPHPQLRAQSS